MKSIRAVFLLSLLAVSVPARAAEDAQDWSAFGHVLTLLQTELARYMGMCGKSNLKALGRDLVKVHGPLPAKTATTNN